MWEEKKKKEILKMHKKLKIEFSMMILFFSNLKNLISENLILE